LTERDRIIVALDMSEPARALELAGELSHAGINAVKVGLELFHAGGPEIVHTLVEQGNRVFLDLKYHDIPVTVERAVRQAVRLGVWMMNVHVWGGLAMMRRAVQAVREEAARHQLEPPLLLGVTVLTSLDAEVVQQELGLQQDVAGLVVRLAQLAARAGLDGVVASPREVLPVNATCGDSFLTVTPGIRPAEHSGEDHRRIATPGEARAAGADYLVIGRPIRNANNPAKAALAIAEELEQEQGRLG
jgi:orotidine-5'-phosphate decarboxylase